MAEFLLIVALVGGVVGLGYLFGRSLGGPASPALLIGTGVLLPPLALGLFLGSQARRVVSSDAAPSGSVDLATLQASAIWSKKWGFAWPILSKQRLSNAFKMSFLGVFPDNTIKVYETKMLEKNAFPSFFEIKSLPILEGQRIEARPFNYSKGVVSTGGGRLSVSPQVFQGFEIVLMQPSGAIEKLAESHDMDGVEMANLANELRAVLAVRLGRPDRPASPSAGAPAGFDL